MKNLILIICFLAFTSLAFAQTEQDNNSRSNRRDPNGERVTNKIIISDAYPNPAQGEFTLDYNLGKDVKEAKVTIYNVLGAAMQEVELTRKEIQVQVPVGKLGPGLYFYTVSIDGVNELTKRLVIRR